MATMRTQEIFEWRGIKLPPLPPEYIWFEYMGDPTICWGDADADEYGAWKNYPYGWTFEHVGAAGSASVFKQKNAARVPIEADTLEEALAVLAQHFWLGAFE